MKKLTLLLVSLILFLLNPLCAHAEGPNVDSILRVLDEALSRRDYYYMLRETRIDSLKRVVRTGALNDADKRKLLYNIFDEYSAYQGDSARVYAMRLHDLAEGMTPDDRVIANGALLTVYITGGMFKEAAEVIGQTGFAGVSPDVRGDFYFICIRLYSDLSNYSSGSFGDTYRALSHAYADSVLMFKHPESYEAHYATVFKTIPELSLDQKIAEFSDMLDRTDIDQAEKAKIASILADFYSEKDDKRSMTFYKALSTLLDIKTAKHETTASRDLALTLFREGDLDRASVLIQLARDDADFFNARHRKMEINNVLPMIEQARYSNLAGQRDRWMWAMVVVSILLVALLVAVYFNIRQLKRLRQSHIEIERRNRELDEAKSEIEQRNRDLQQSNARLSESNKIKDGYVGYGFALNAKYMDKIEGLYRMVDQRLAEKQYDELRKSLRKRDLREDKESLLQEFDKIFLRLFPDFVAKYNALFPEGEGSYPQEGGEALTSEMRIFALIRLGINDSSQIATLLNYSVNTVNTYKTKAKNRSTVPNERFESAVMDIKSVS